MITLMMQYLNGFLSHYWLSAMEALHYLTRLLITNLCIFYSQRNIISGQKVKKKNILFQSKILESKIIDFTNFKKKDFSKNFKINKYKYDNYKYRYLTHKTKNTQKPINKIIQDLMQNLSANN